MPLYDYSCECGLVDTDVYRTIADRVAKCKNCGEEVRPDIYSSPPAGHIFKQGTYRHLTGDNKTWFSSKKQLRAEADKRGKYSEYAHG